MRQWEFSLVAQAVSVVYLPRELCLCAVLCCVVLLLLVGAERVVVSRSADDGARPGQSRRHAYHQG